MVFCAVCFGDPNSPLTHGYNYGIMSLLAVTFVILGLLGMMFWNIRQKTIKNQT
ncbi:MAG: hypothetical protein HY209_06770 [Candidatus Omnitrophica bacterium]|nr:hypothetical protein [Candidatus Omnitrophota bacterium]